MKLTRETILNRCRLQISLGNPIIGVAAGSGMTTRYSVKGGADLILALSAGKFRQAGRASLGSYLCYGNSNDVVMEFATRELRTLIGEVPILFGLNATDPGIVLEEYIAQIREAGLAGIVNFPTAGLIDGQFREALEENGIGYTADVEAIRIAHEQGLFTLAFVFTPEQTEAMLDAGADILCAHLGLTTGGMLGAKKVHSITQAVEMAVRVFEVCDRRRPEVIRMVYGGPIRSPADAQYFYDNTSCQGFIGGSSFERIPAEKAILNTTRSFKDPRNPGSRKVLDSVLEGRVSEQDYVEYIQDHIAENYHLPVTLNQMAATLHVSAPYLSVIFKKKMGCSFTEYLIRFRMNTACQFLGNERLSIGEVAENVGYNDPAQFSKTFKKYKGVSPRAYRASVLSRELPAE